MNENKCIGRRTAGWISVFDVALLGLTLFVLVGCSSMPSLHMPSLSLTAAPLKLDLTANLAAGQIIHSKRPVVLSIAKYADARATPNSEKIGDISAAVNDMLGTELRLQDIAGTVTGAVENQLRASGFQTIADTGKPAANADFVISGAVKEFSMMIAGRDAVAIAVETTLRDAHSGSVLWSGVVTEMADRFAGVTGNSRNSITRYLSAALGKVSGKTRDALSEGIMQARPDLFFQAAPARQATPGVTVLIAPPEPAQVLQAAQPGNTGMATGRLTLTTTPSRAKVYMADVYYGLTPLNLELEPGIYPLRFKLDGFQTATEKVSVRKGETTELETKLDK
jgi:hypothetical protein